MRAECVLEVAQAIGRTPTEREIAEFEGGLLAQMRELARSDRAAWQSMTGAQRLQAAAEMAQRAALEAADKQAQRRASNLVAQARETERLTARAKTLAGRGVKNPHHAALFERFRQIDDYVAGVRNEALSHLIDAVHAVAPRFLGLMDDPAAVRSFARAVMDGNAETPEMGKAAKAYTEALDTLRERSNAAGTDIGKLDYGYLPQPHDVGKVARAGADQWAQAVLPRLARDRYVSADGNLMGDAELIDLLRGAWESISTEGRNQMVPGQSAGRGSRAAAHDDKHRAIHFKDADSYLDYIAEFGRGSMMSAIHGHVGQMAKSIGLMEEFGANPTSTYRLLKDTAAKLDNATGVHEQFATTDMVWDTLNGTTSQPVSAGLAQFWQGVRNFTTATKLQGVMLSAITDVPLQWIVAKTAGVPLGKALASPFSGFGGKKRVIAHELALGVDEIAGEMARWHQDNLAQGWTAKLANTTMRLTLVEGWSNSLRRGFSLTLSGALERQRHTAWDALDDAGRRRFEAAGVTADDWAIWQRAAATDVGGSKLLTKDGIRALADVPEADKNRAVARLLGYLDQEARTAVLAPDIMTRATIQQGTRAGTWGGEVLRSFMLFKSFPLGIVFKHLRRLQSIPSTRGKAAYSVAMMTSLTLFGALSLTLQDLSNGRDPRDPTTGKFWLAAFLKGGGAGIFGDILYTGMGGNARGGQANWTSLAGPVFGNMMDFADLTLGNAYRAAEGKKTDVAADTLRFTRNNLPLVNLWYLRGAVDHMVLHDLQEQVSPGYLRRMRKRARKDWGQDYWWAPGENLPERAPDVGSDRR